MQLLEYSRGPEITVVTEPLLLQAIRDLRLVQFEAHGYLRIGEPHLIGETFDGMLQLEFFQTAGQTSKRTSRLPEWRCFNVCDIIGVELLDQAFSPRREFDARPKNWKTILSRVPRGQTSGELLAAARRHP